MEKIKRNKNIKGKILIEHKILRKKFKVLIFVN